MDTIYIRCDKIKENGLLFIYKKIAYLDFINIY